MSGIPGLLAAEPLFIRTITLWQPWAQWVMLGWKEIETRTHPRFQGLARERIGIHAALKWDSSAIEAARSFLSEEQITATRRMPDDFEGGKVLGTVSVVESRWLSADDSKLALIECGTRRHGLVLREPELFSQPIAAQGGRGIWKFVFPPSEFRNIEAFPGIKAAALAIAYDNGKINRFETQEDFLKRVGAVLVKYSPKTVEEINAWLVSLSEAEIDVYCTGESSEIEEMNDEGAPEKAMDLMEAIFEL